MPRDGAIIFSDLIGKLDMLRVACDKCGRDGRYRLPRLILDRGADTKLPDWLNDIAAGCPKRHSVNWNDRCRAQCRICRGCCNNVPRQLRWFLFARLLLFVERHQTYVGRALAREDGPRQEVLAQFALPLRKGGRALPVERELVVLGVMDGLAGVAEAVRDRRALRLLTLGKLRQFTPTLGRGLRETFGFRIAGVLEVTFGAFGPSSICFCRMHDPR